VDVLDGGDDDLDVAGRRIDVAHLLQAALAVDLGGAEARLALAPLVDADDAPRDVVVDRRALPGQPDQGDDREAAARRDVQQVLGVVVGARDAMLGREPAVVGEQRAEPRADGVGIVDESVYVRGEGGEGMGRHAGPDARGRREPVGLLTQRDER